jgi:hypothetical protein
MEYKDFEIEVTDPKRERAADRKWMGHFKVRVLHSEAGEMADTEAVPVQYDLKDLRRGLRRLDKRELDREGLIDLGRTLAMLLLPPAEEGSPSNVRGLFAKSMNLAGQDAGIRLRLRLPPQLAWVPWEYLYVDRAGGGNGKDGFLALDPRVAIVRHEPLLTPTTAPLATGSIKVVVALASHIDLDTLDLDQELDDLEEAFDGLTGIEPVYLEDATLDDILGAIPSTKIFHFAGHGMFAQEISGTPGFPQGKGALALDDDLVEAEDLGLNLQGNGVRLALLGGCETGRRGADGSGVWDSIAPALVKAKIPAVVANQYSILDKCAIAFSRKFYQSLVGGLSIERAVAAGRLAAYNADKEGRDWGVPVLYLRAKNGELFEGAPDTGVRQQAKADAEGDVKVRVKDVAKGGEVLGGDVRHMLAGKLGINVEVSGTVYGKVVALKVDTFGGGSANVDMDIDTVGEGGSATAVSIDTLGS